MHIYKFTHIESNRCYIGQTIQDPNIRRLEHLSRARCNKGAFHLHRAIRLYGENAFLFEVIAEATTLDELNLLEQQFIKQFDSIKNGFNMREGGGNKKHSQESIGRMKESQKAAHARRRSQGRDTFTKTRKTSGWTNTETAKKNKSIAALNREKLTCPHCGLIGQISGMKRWHFDNCKKVAA